MIADDNICKSINKCIQEGVVLSVMRIRWFKKLQHQFPYRAPAERSNKDYSREKDDKRILTAGGDKKKKKKRERS